METSIYKLQAAHAVFSTETRNFSTKFNGILLFRVAFISLGLKRILAQILVFLVDFCGCL